MLEAHNPLGGSLRKSSGYDGGLSVVAKSIVLTYNVGYCLAPCFFPKPRDSSYQQILRQSFSGISRALYHFGGEWMIRNSDIDPDYHQDLFGVKERALLQDIFEEIIVNPKVVEKVENVCRLSPVIAR